MKPVAVLVCLSHLAAAAAPAAAQPATIESDPDVVGKPQLWPALAALGPGLLVHGAGHIAMGEQKTGLRLLAIEGAGLAAAVLGLTGLVLTGAAPRTVWPLAGLVMIGGGAFVSSALADIYGVFTPEGGTGRALPLPRLELEVGPVYVDDPSFDYDVLSYVGAIFRWGRLSLLGQTHVALDADNQRFRALVAYRLWRPRLDTWLDLEIGIVHHRYGEQRFNYTFGELALASRLGLGALGHTLEGAFVDVALGYAPGANHYDNDETEFDEMMLGRLGFGLYLGHQARRWGEAALFYDHRHDGYAGGLKMRGLGSGPVGSVGVRGRYYLSQHVGLATELAVGSAFVGGVSLLYRTGGLP